MASKHGGTEYTYHEMRGTAIFITVSITFLFLTDPANIAFAINITPNLVLLGVPYYSVALNHSINAFLYCAIGTKFRKEFIEELCSPCRNFSNFFLK